MVNKKVILTVALTMGAFVSVVIVGCAKKENKELSNNSKVENNINNNIDSNKEDKNNEKDKEDKNNYDGVNEIKNVKIDFNVNLENEKELLTIISKSFKKYYDLDIPTDGSIKFNLNKSVTEKTGEEILNAAYVGKLGETQYYLNIVINKTKKNMERIDRYNYSVKESEEKISTDEAKKIAEKFLKKVDLQKYNLAKNINVTESSRDGYRVIFEGEKQGNNNPAIIVAVNPYSSIVSSFMDFWGIAE